jgi:protoheme IX farnesyltransferase
VVSNAQQYFDKLTYLNRSPLKRPMATDLLPTKTPSSRHPEKARESRVDFSSNENRTGRGTEPQATEATKSTPSVFQDYIQLTKPRIVVMILVTTIATAFIGAGAIVSGIDLAWLMIGTAAVAGSAGAANQIWERSIDRRMIRTANRPLPSGRQQTIPAVVFMTVLGIVGTGVLTAKFGPLPALAGLATWLLYVLVYTPMKTRTAWNTTVGAVAGALPVLIGYTATGGQINDWTPWLLVGVLVAWQYPHFMSIAWMYRRQYAEAGFCMTTTVEPTGRSAGWQSIAGSIALIACAVILCFIPNGVIGAIVGAIAVVAASTPMLSASIRFAENPNDQQARKLLRSSLLVLPAVLAVVTIRVFW